MVLHDNAYTNLENLDLEQKYISKLIEAQEKHGPILYITKVGSQLYGTNNEHSDTDYRGVYLNTPNDLVLQKANEFVTISKGSGNKSKNSNTDVDFDLWSYNKFVRLLQKGDTGAFDLLYSLMADHSDYIHILHNDYNGILSNLVKEAWKFTSKNTNAFIGYCVAQARKYGDKGDRYRELMSFKTDEQLFVTESNSEEGVAALQKTKLKDHMYKWDLKDYKYVSIVDGEGANRTSLNYLKVLDKKYAETITVGEFISKLKSLEDKYGDRTKASMDGEDWKALSHAVRIIGQVEELIEHGRISLPIIDVDLVRGIKEGHLTRKEVNDIISVRLMSLDLLVEQCNHPDKVDSEFVDSLIFAAYEG